MRSLKTAGSWLFLYVQLFFYVHWGSAANCTLSNWGWATNSLGQDPCEVTVLLEGACWNEGGPLAPLQQGYNYVTPQRNGTPPNTPCECNTIMYSLYSACTACQNVTPESWTYFEKNCDTVYVSQYPIAIPFTTRVPHWAYLNVSLTSNMFDAAAASAVANQPESTPLMPSTATVPGSSSSGSGSTTPSSNAANPIGTSLPSGAPSQSVVTNASKSSNTGAIAGGTVGGIVGLVLIGGVIAYFVIRHKKSASADPTLMSHSPYSDIPPSETLRPYDPSDPSTFPLPLGQPSTTYEGSSSFNQTAYTTAKRGYNGVAEV